MRTRWMFGLTLFCVTAFPFLASAQEKKPPTVVVRFRSLDALIQQAKLVATIAGKSEEAKQVEGLIKSRVGPKGLAGIDLKRPFGGYARVGDGLNQVSGALMIPIADQADFLDLLKNLNVRFSKDAAGIYTVKIDAPVDVYFRFANKYAYATVIALDSVQDKNLIAPSKIFPPMMKDTISATVRIDQIPEQAKQIALISLEAQLEKKVGKEGFEREFATKVNEELVGKFKKLLDEAEALNLGFDIDPATKQMTFSSNLTAKSEPLSAAIDKIGNAKTLFANMFTKSAAVSGLMHMSLPAPVQKGLEQAFTQIRNKALEKIDDAAKRKKAKELFKALEPTAKSGEIDAAFNMFKPEGSNRYGLVMAMKLRDGDQLGDLVRTLAKELLNEVPAEERNRIKIDALTVGKVKVHQLDVQDKFDAKARKAFGDNPVYLAFRNDAVFFATGDGGLKQLKKVLGSDSATKGPVLKLRVSLARLGELMAENDAQRQIVQTYANSGEQGRVSVSVQADSALKMEITADLSLVKLFTDLDKAKKQQ